MPPRKKKAAALALGLVAAPADAVTAPPAKRACHEPKRLGVVTGKKLEAIHEAVDALYDELYTFRGTPDDDAEYTPMWPVRDWEAEQAYIVLKKVEVEGCFQGFETVLKYSYAGAKDEMEKEAILMDAYRASRGRVEDMSSRFNS